MRTRNIALGLALVITSCFVPAQTKGGFNFYSASAEQKLGDQMAAQISNEMPTIDDPMLVAYSQQITARLASSAHTDFPISAQVVRCGSANAFSIPGGKLYICLEMIAQSQNEAELAGVLAHEMGHIEHRDGTRALTRSEIFRFVAIPAMFVGGPVGLALRPALEWGGAASLMKYSRTAERDADAEAVRLLQANGYDAQAFSQVFTRLEAGARQKHSLFASHPADADRARSIQALAQQDDSAPQLIDSSDFQDAHNRALELMQGETAAPVLRSRKPQAEEVEAKAVVSAPLVSSPVFHDLRDEMN